MKFDLSTKIDYTIIENVSRLVFIDLFIAYKLHIIKTLSKHLFDHKHEQMFFILFLNQMVDL